MRLISKELNMVFNNSKSNSANFGLLFNKMLEYKNGLDDFRPTCYQDRRRLVSQYQESLMSINSLLKKRHLSHATFCRNMEKAGWKTFVFHAELKSPFVTGLGMSHPTETCLVLDHTIGVPYMPAAGQKGILRLAHMINALTDDNGKEKDIEQLLEKGVIEEKNNGEFFWNGDDAFKTLFGYSEKKDSLAGQLVVLDAYPLTAPELDEEILNPHYPDYYKGQRGPTEDQNPIPIKFLVVRPGGEFVFRILLRRPLAKSSLGEGEQQQLESIVKKNIKRALKHEGLGAKTALGFGRFDIIAEGEPDDIVQEGKKLEEKREKERLVQQKEQERKQMTEAERLVLDLKENEFDKKEINEIFTKLESFSQNDRILVASALKGYWQRHNAWSKKGCSKKQWKKVRDRINMVKKILGEQ